MNTEHPLVSARSSIVWLLAIGVAFGSVWWIEKKTGKELIAHSGDGIGATHIDYTSDKLTLPVPRPLEPREKEWATTAWVYFEKNVDAQTGLAHSVAGFPSASLWDEGSYLMALIAASRLGIISVDEFDARVSRALASLARLPLTAAGLPNKAYDVHTLAMTDYRNQPTATGIGVSAIDIARLTVPLHAIVWRYPKHTEATRAVFGRWNMASLSRNGFLHGLAGTDGKWQSVQEGRTGYEQYAASALAPWHLDAGEAARWDARLRWVKVDGVSVPADSRKDAPIDAVVSEPYVLTGLELGWSPISRELAWRVYSAQEAHFRSTGQLTAVSEDHLDRAPYFAYNAVYARGQPWVALSSEGATLPGLQTFSVKAAFAWHALLRTAYTAQLVEKAAALKTPDGWYAGAYESDGQPNKSINCNTNAVVLESLAYIAAGPLGGAK